MKAIQINSYGSKEVFSFTADAQRPAISEDQVLVEVYAAGINPFDYKVASGMMKAVFPLKFPAILGGDFAGVVAEVGANVTHVTVGDEVYGEADALSSHGSFAEFTPVAGSSVAKKPANTTFVEAGSLPLAGVSAYQALVDHGHVQSGQTVLIHGAAGGIGSIAVQLAHHLGAKVIATAAGEDADFVKKLGADKVIDYKTQDFSALISGADFVFDTVGSETTAQSYGVLKKGGILVSMVSQPDEALVESSGIEFVAQGTMATTERLIKLAELVEQAAISPQVDKIFPLEEAAEALDYLSRGKHIGKVVLEVKK